MKQSVSKEEFFILQKMIEGDEHAFKYFFDTYYDDLCNFANGYLRDEALSEEIIQDIFVYLWEKKDSLLLTGSVKSYLFTASKNKSLNYLRNLKNQNRIIGELAPDTELTAGGADQYLETEELKRIIEEAIDKLPPKCKVIWQLSRNQGMTHNEIATELGITVKTVENQITIAIRKIKEFLLPYYDQIFILFLMIFFPFSFGG
jgi:RNA polymerase sigma-70 factor (ECF subfamily)